MPIADPTHRVRLEGVDFARAFPSLRLFESFRMALQPTKVLLGLLGLLLIYLSGVMLDLLWGRQEAVLVPLMGRSVTQEYYIFERIFTAELSWFGHLIASASRLDVGLDGFGRAQPSGMLVALWQMVVAEPARLWDQHPWFFAVLVVVVGVIMLVVGGAIARLAATQACLDETVGVSEAARFTLPRAAWFVVSPLIPLVVVGSIWLGLAVVGGVLFNVPGLNVVGGLLYWLMLLGGLVAACLLAFVAVGAGMMPSALAVEGTDAFDAVSRVFTFLIYRPARYLVLLVVALIYGALTYLLVGMVLYLALWFTRSATGAWSQEVGAMMQLPGLGRPPAKAVLAEPINDTYHATAWLIAVWSKLLFGVSIAYAVSYFFTAQTWMYLLLRREVDGTDFADAYVSPSPAVAVGEKLEPREVSAEAPPVTEASPPVGTAPADGEVAGPDDVAPEGDPEPTPPPGDDGGQSAENDEAK